jgi:hypothetical protein
LDCGLSKAEPAIQHHASINHSGNLYEQTKHAMDNILDALSGCAGDRRLRRAFIIIIIISTCAVFACGDYAACRR